jgi:hypothetical protein
LAAAEEWERGRVETAVHAGFFDTEASTPSLEAGLEVRRSTALENLAILGGITGNDDGGAWIYGGARYDLGLSERWTLTPGFAVTLYEKGDGKELGQTLEFRSSIEVARRVSDRLRVGFVFYHLSNASLSETNPGANSAIFNFAFRRPRSDGD